MPQPTNIPDKRKQQFLYMVVRDFENISWKTVRLNENDLWELVNEIVEIPEPEVINEDLHPVDYSWGVHELEHDFHFVQGTWTNGATGTHAELRLREGEKRFSNISSIADPRNAQPTGELDSEFEFSPFFEVGYPISMQYNSDGSAYWMDWDYKFYKTTDGFLNNEGMSSPVELLGGEPPFPFEARDIASDPNNPNHLICKGTTLDLNRVDDDSGSPNNWELLILESFDSGMTWYWHQIEEWPLPTDQRYLGGGSFVPLADSVGLSNEIWDQDYWYFNEHNLNWLPDGTIYWINEVIHYKGTYGLDELGNVRNFDEPGYPIKEVWLGTSGSPSGPWDIQILRLEDPSFGGFSIFNQHLTYNGGDKWFIYSEQNAGAQSIGFELSEATTHIWQSGTPADPSSWVKLPSPGFDKTTSPCYWPDRNQLYIASRGSPGIRRFSGGGWTDATFNLESVLGSGRWDTLWGGMPLWISPNPVVRTGVNVPKGIGGGSPRNIR